MSLDQYAPCPCGSGKKFKYCKCVDQPQEYEKIVRLIEGKQELAALDRVNQLLAKTPSTAWLLALKCELTLRLEELDPFREASLRFLKLKPDNPLALTFRSITASLFGEPSDVASRYLLDGLAESRENLNPQAMVAIHILISSLLRDGKTGFCHFWTDILDTLTESSDMQRPSLEENPDTNMLARTLTHLMKDPPGVPWGERLNEVNTLAGAFRFSQAESKLRTILRDFPDQPGPLSHLLRAQTILIDQPGAVATARKLASLPSLEEYWRAYYRAYSFELEQPRESLTTRHIIKYCEIESEEDVVKRLNDTGLIVESNDEMSLAMRKFLALTVNDEVPARKIFTILDHPISTDPDATQTPSRAVGTLAILAKQTDKPSRAFLMAFRQPEFDEVIGKMIVALSALRDIDDPYPTRKYDYVSYLQRQTYYFNRKAALELETDSLVSQRVISDFLNMTMDVLGGSTLLEAAQDESKHELVRSLLSHFEGQQSIMVEDTAFDELYHRLNVERPQVALDKDANSIRVICILDLERVKVDQMSDNELVSAFISARDIHAHRIQNRFSHAIMKREKIRDDEQLRPLVLEALLQYTRSPDTMLELLEQLQSAVALLKSPVGQIIIQRCNVLASLGRHPEATKVLTDGIKNYPADPFLHQFIQQLQQSYETSSVDVDRVTSQQIQMRQNQVRSDSLGAFEDSVPEPHSSLLLPGQEPSTSGQSKSKLWLPGS